MSARKITPEECFSVTTHIDLEYSRFPPDIFLKNGWAIFDLPTLKTPYEFEQWRGLSEQDATVFYRSEGKYEQSSICGLRLGDTMVFFDENYELRAELRAKALAGDADLLAGTTLSDKYIPRSERDRWADLVWFMTSTGHVFWSAGGNHALLYSRTQNVLRCDIVAAGRVRDDMSFVWESDLLNVGTSPTLRPTLEVYLKNLRNTYGFLF